MTVKEAQREYERIGTLATESDHEVTHVAADDFMLCVLRSIADGTCENPQRCAGVAVAAYELPFEKWFA